MTTVERSLIRASSMSSPRLSVRRELTPPSISSSISESTLFHIHDRLNQLDSKVLDLRNSVLTKDAYVDRRNREDEFIRREFETHRQIAGRIDSNVLRQKTDLSQLKLDISQLKSEIGQLKSNVGLLGTGSQFLQNDIDRLRRDVNQLQVEIQQIQVDVRGTRTDLSQIQAVVSQLRTDFMILQRETNKHFGDVSSRFSLMESRMKHMERVRFNSLAHTIHAPITPVPYLEDDGTVKWPEYFPRTVWRFWCLKKKNRVHRLAELAEFYQLEGCQYWGRMHPSQEEMLYDDESDSSDSSDLAPNLTRAEAARLYPEACHQALAATLGLVYYKIRNEVGEGPLSHITPRPQKRPQDDVVSMHSSARPKSGKIPRTSNDASPTRLYRLITGPALETKSIVSEGLDKLGWNVNSQISDDTMSKLKGLVTEEFNTLLLRAVEHGRIKLKPSRSEAKDSPTDSRMSAGLPNRSNAEPGAQEDEIRTVSNTTVPTEPLSPRSGQVEMQNAPWIPDTRSEVSSPC